MEDHDIVLDLDNKIQDWNTSLKSNNNNNGPFQYQRKCNNIKTLLLRNNMLTTFAPYNKWLIDMRHTLRELTLRNNNFKEFPEEVIILVNLISLSVAKNQLRVIHTNIFPHLLQLTWLSLSNNYLQELPSDLDRCQNLLGIDISNNEFDHMPPVIHKLNRLRVLLMQKNKLHTLSKYRVFPPSLQTLNISFNHFEQLPTILIYDPPSHLTHLHLSGNPIKDIPKEFLKYEYQHLVNLDLHSCQLKELSTQFFIYLGKRRIPLCRLNLAINQLKSLPDTIGMATSLQWLNLNDNQLTSLPSTMVQLHYLAKLGLVQNQLKELPSYFFYRMHYLEKLDLRKNQLSYLPPSILSLVPSNEIHQHIDLAVLSITFPLRYIHTHQSKSELATTSLSKTLFNHLYDGFYDNNNNDNNKEYTRMVTMMDTLTGGDNDQENDLYKQQFGGSLKTLLLYDNPLLERKDGIFCYKSNNQHEEGKGKEKEEDDEEEEDSDCQINNNNDNINNQDDDEHNHSQNISNWYQLVSMEELKGLFSTSNSSSSEKYSTFQILRENLLSYLNRMKNKKDHKVKEELELNNDSQNDINSFTHDFPSLKDLALTQYLKKSHHDWIMKHSTKQCYSKANINHHHDSYDYTYQELIQQQQNVLCRLDIQPDTRVQFLSTVLPKWIPYSLRQKIIKRAKQCDHCGQWGMNLSFQIGYLAKLCNNRIQVPVRYSLCSSLCAMDSAYRLLFITDHWRSKRLESALNLTENGYDSHYHHPINSLLSSYQQQQQQSQSQAPPQYYDLYHYFYKYPSIIDNYYDDTYPLEDTYRRGSYSSTSTSSSSSSNENNNHDTSHRAQYMTTIPFINHLTNESSILNNTDDQHDLITQLNIILNQQQPTILLPTLLTQPNYHHHLHDHHNSLSEALFQRDQFKITDPHLHLTSFNHFPGDAIKLERF